MFHHGRFYKNFAGDSDPVAKYVGVDQGSLFNITGTAWVWLPMWFVWPAGAVAVFCGGLVHAFLWTAVHREMHEPHLRWFRNTRYFRYVEAYHRYHHEHPGRNFNALFPPLGDWLFGTGRAR
jgi:hypothetical protein